MPLTDTEIKITKIVVDRFFNLNESTSRKSLITNFEDPDALERLLRYSILRRSDDQRTFRPMALAFHYVGDEALRNRARTSVQTVLHVLKTLYVLEKEGEEYKQYTTSEIQEQALKMYERVEPNTISFGLYLGQEFGVFQALKFTESQTEIVSVAINENIVRKRDIDSAWDNHVQQTSAYLERKRSQERIQALLLRFYDLAKGQEGVSIAPIQYIQAALDVDLYNDEISPTMEYLASDGLIIRKAASEVITLTRKGILEARRIAPKTEVKSERPIVKSPDTDVLVFISHSSKDADLALALIELLKAGLALRADQIRCSSVDGYRLPVGVNSEAKLREEVNSAKAVIGIITPNSLSSAFVMFELGARWGANLFLAPLLAGVRPSELSGPLNLLNALSCSSDAQLHQLIENIGQELGLPLQNPASYVRYVANLRQLSAGVTAAPAKANVEQPEPEKHGNATKKIDFLRALTVLRSVEQEYLTWKEVSFDKWGMPPPAPKWLPDEWPNIVYLAGTVSPQLRKKADALGTSLSQANTLINRFLSMQVNFRDTQMMVKTHKLLVDAGPDLATLLDELTKFEKALV